MTSEIKYKLLKAVVQVAGCEDATSDRYGSAQMPPTTSLLALLVETDSAPLSSADLYCSACFCKLQAISGRIGWCVAIRCCASLAISFQSLHCHRPPPPTAPRYYCVWLGRFKAGLQGPV